MKEIEKNLATPSSKRNLSKEKWPTTFHWLWVCTRRCRVLVAVGGGRGRFVVVVVFLFRNDAVRIGGMHG